MHFAHTLNELTHIVHFTAVGSTNLKKKIKNRFEINTVKSAATTENFLFCEFKPLKKHFNFEKIFEMGGKPQTLTKL